MTTRDDSLRLDTAIRNAVAFGGLPLTGRFEAAFAAVLDLHKPQAIDSLEPDGPQFCPSCTDDREPFADYPCSTIRAIARELRVSSQDTPAPLPVEPRVLRDPQMYRDGDPWRWFEAHPGLFTYAPDWATARAFADPPHEGICRNHTLERLRAKYGELTDVTADHPVTEESPSTQGGER